MVSISRLSMLFYSPPPSTSWSADISSYKASTGRSPSIELKSGMPIVFEIHITRNPSSSARLLCFAPGIRSGPGYFVVIKALKGRVAHWLVATQQVGWCVYSCSELLNVDKSELEPVNDLGLQASNGVCGSDPSIHATDVQWPVLCNGPNDY